MLLLWRSIYFHPYNKSTDIFGFKTYLLAHIQIVKKEKDVFHKLLKNVFKSKQDVPIILPIGKNK